MTVLRDNGRTSPQRPIWDNQSRGYTIDLLERPVGRVAQGEPLTLARQLVEPRDPYELLAGGLDAQHRLRQVLLPLKPEHRRGSCCAPTTTASPGRKRP